MAKLKEIKYGKHYIKEWRRKRGLTQKQVCERMETSEGGELFLSEASLSRIEKGEQPFTEETIYPIAIALDVDPSDLLYCDPFKEGEVIDLIRKLDNRDRGRIIEMMKVMVKSA